MHPLLTTLEYVPGKEIAEVLGLVKGNTVRSKHIGKDILAGLKTLIGGEIKVYVEAISEAREEATLRMLNEAERLGADAVLGVRYSTSQIMTGAAELMAYGTAVKLK